MENMLSCKLQHVEGLPFLITRKHTALMAICNARYQFTVVDIGDSGRQSDGSVYANSNLGYAIENKQVKLSGEIRLRNSQRILPHVFVGDDTFGLKLHMMKTYPSQNLPIDRRVFNYRLSCTRRIIENVFGICASRFRVLRRPIIASPKKAVLITKAIVALHNFLMSITEDNFDYYPTNFVDQDGPNGLVPGEWRKDSNDITGIVNIRRAGSNNHSRNV